MPISARNQLRGTIQQLVLGNVMAHVVVRVGENVIESVIETERLPCDFGKAQFVQT